MRSVVPGMILPAVYSFLKGKKVSHGNIVVEITQDNVPNGFRT